MMYFTDVPIDSRPDTDLAEIRALGRMQISHPPSRRGEALAAAEERETTRRQRRS